jgi:hypothetical protein
LKENRMSKQTISPLTDAAIERVADLELLLQNATSVPLSLKSHTRHINEKHECDHCATLEREKEDYASTLKAWFDTAKKAEEELIPILLDGLKGYLRTSQNGGMPSEDADTAYAVLEDFCRLYVGKAVVPIIRALRDEERTTLERERDEARQERDAQKAHCLEMAGEMQGYREATKTAEARIAELEAEVARLNKTIGDMVSRKLFPSPTIDGGER